jgi:anthranilate phosphoribosyltransferase
MDTPNTDQEMLPAARFIKEIGRGKDGARSLNLADAALMYGAMLDGRISDLELGAIVLSLRIKGESVEELTGFLQAAQAAMDLIAAPDGAFAPILIPSYNGARKMPNLTPLLALLLAKEGVPVLVHGVETDPGRVTTCEVMTALGLPMPQQQAHLHAIWARKQPAFMSIRLLAPKMARLLALRRVLGVRGSTHTLVKLLQPFACPAVRMTSYTHPEYQILLSSYFSQASSLGDAILMRATEGETVANVRRAQEVVCFQNGVRTTVVDKQDVADIEPDLPAERDADTTARWIDDVLCGVREVPAAIAEQVAQCQQISAQLRVRSLLAAIGEDTV